MECCTGTLSTNAHFQLVEPEWIWGYVFELGLAKRTETRHIGTRHFRSPRTVWAQTQIKLRAGGGVRWGIKGDLSVLMPVICENKSLYRPPQWKEPLPTQATSTSIGFSMFLTVYTRYWPHMFIFHHHCYLPQIWCKLYLIQLCIQNKS